MASPKYTATRRVVYMDPDTRKMISVAKNASFDPPDSVIEALTKNGAIVPYVEPTDADAERAAKATAEAERQKARNAAVAKQAEVRAADGNMIGAGSTDSNAVRSVPGKSLGSPTTTRGG